MLEEHEIYTPMTKRRRKAQDASENASALDAFGSIGCMDSFGIWIGNERALGVYYASIRFSFTWFSFDYEEIYKKDISRKRLRPSYSYNVGRSIIVPKYFDLVKNSTHGPTVPSVMFSKHYHLLGSQEPVVEFNHYDASSPRSEEHSQTSKVRLDCVYYP